jgi:hypothetical protein
MRSFKKIRDTLREVGVGGSTVSLLLMLLEEKTLVLGLAKALYDTIYWFIKEFKANYMPKYQ